MKQISTTFFFFFQVSIWDHLYYQEGFPGGSDSKESTCNAGDTGDMGLTLGQEDPWEEEMATHSSILA